MEVHAHTHTPRKKLTHYFWEFLMLFLAVFCGFLAEYQLEHKIEKEREKKYIASMVADLTDDTTRLNRVINNCINKFKGIDSLQYSFDKVEFTDDSKLYEMYFQSIGVPVFITNDRTSRQLINSGNMRLINKAVLADSIIDYYGVSKDMTQGIIDDLKFYMYDTYLFSQDIFDINSLKTNLKEDSTMNYEVDLPKMKLLTKDKIIIKKYLNKNASCKLRIGNLLSHLILMKKKSIALLTLLKKEYRLK